MLQLEIDNPVLEDRLMYFVQEQKLQLQDIAAVAIEQYIARLTEEKMLDSHKKELDRRAKKYENIDKSQLMGLDVLHKKFIDDIQKDNLSFYRDKKNLIDALNA